jgi:hypothetical protein
MKERISMAIIRLVNPTRNKSLTRDEVAGRQAQAAQFTRDVVGDPGLADEIKNLSVEQYADRKGFQLVNPNSRLEVKKTMTTQTARTNQQPDLGAELDRMSKVIEQLRSRLPARRANPAAEHPDDLGAKLDRASAALEAARRGRMSNPDENSDRLPSPRGQRQVRKLREQRDEILDALEDVQNALDEDQPDEAQEILDEILDQYEVEDEN